MDLKTKLNWEAYQTIRNDIKLNEENIYESILLIFNADNEKYRNSNVNKIFKDKIVFEEKKWFALLELLVADSIFCYTDILRLIKTSNDSYIFNHRFFAEIYRRLAKWAEIYEALENIKKYNSSNLNENPKMLNEAILKFSDDKMTKIEKHFYKINDIIKQYFEKDMIVGKIIENIRLDLEKDTKPKKKIENIKQYLENAIKSYNKIKKITIDLEKYPKSKEEIEEIINYLDNDMNPYKIIEKIRLDLEKDMKPEEKIKDIKQYLKDAVNNTMEKFKQYININKYLEKFLEKDFRGYVSKRYYSQKAFLHYNKSIETHAGGRAYYNLLEQLYFIKGDYDDATSHFNVAIERFMINNTDSYKKHFEELKKDNEKSSLYKTENYVETDTENHNGDS